MKKILCYAMAVVLVFSAGCAETPEEEANTTGSIHGTITDKATGNPVPSANVQLRPSGKTELTGNDGYYEIQEVEAGEYTLKVTKTGYTDLLDDYTITVASGKAVKRDVQIEKLPSSLRVVNDSQQDIDAIDFGSALSSLQFGIFNNTPTSFDWTITENCDWMSVSPTSGKSAAGATTTVTVTIERDKITDGINTNTILISSVSYGNKTLTVTAAGNGLPALITNAATSTTNNSATLNGEITDGGTPAYTERGFVYSSSSSMPTTENTITKLTAAVTANKLFTANVMNLTANETYYVRAYAINSLGTAYGNVVSFNTGGVQTTLSTSAVTDISLDAATLNGTITYVGMPAYSERGFCYDANITTPTTANTKVAVAGSGSGEYSTSITGLTQEKTYHVRTYAIQGTEVIYGNSVTFTTTGVTQTSLSASAASNIGASSVTLNATIIDAGAPAYSERGFCYNKTGNPTTADTKRTVSGSGIGNYSVSVDGLDLQATYYVRAYVIQSGAPIYSNSISFTTVWVETDISTYAVTNIEAATATFNGVVNNMGQPECSEHGFVYSSTRTSPTTGDTKITFTGYASAYSANVTGLVSNQTYYVRTYAIQTGDPNPVYGSMVQFTTGTPPQVQTLPAGEVSKINQISGDYMLFATLNGNVTNAGSPAYVERGFVYKEEDILFNTPPTYEQSMVVTVPTTGTGSYNTITLQLNHMEWYVVRAYVKTASGVIYYGGTVTFDTWDYTEY